MKVLIASFFVLFSLVELYQWLEGISIPLPIYFIGGLFLAIASNYDKGICSFLESETITYDGELVENSAVGKNSLSDSNGSNSNNSIVVAQEKTSISFKINKV